MLHSPFRLLAVRVLADLLVAGAALGLVRREERLPAFRGGELAALLLVPDALPLRVLHSPCGIGGIESLKNAIHRFFPELFNIFLAKLSSAFMRKLNIYNRDDWTQILSTILLSTQFPP